jgi:hypothetical protein
MKKPLPLGDRALERFGGNSPKLRRGGDEDE